MYTDKDRSIRLKELGYSAETIYNWVLVKDVDGNEDYELKSWYNSDSFPAYSADTLFDWLRENFWEPDVKFFEIQEDGIYLARFDDSWSAWTDFQDSLTNMLADAIIWILEQEKVKWLTP